MDILYILFGNEGFLVFNFYIWGEIMDDTNNGFDPFEIKKMRIGLGLKPGEVAKVIGIAAAHYGRKENGYLEFTGEETSKIFEFFNHYRKTTGSQRITEFPYKDEIRFIRKGLGLTQAEVAKVLGIGRDSYNRKESTTNRHHEFSLGDFKILLGYFHQYRKEFGHDKIPTVMTTEEIGATRKSLGLTQGDTADVLGISRKYYNIKERNKGGRFTRSDKIRLKRYFDHVRNIYSGGKGISSTPEMYEYPDMQKYLGIINYSASLGNMRLLYFTMSEAVETMRKKYKFHKQLETDDKE